MTDGLYQCLYGYLYTCQVSRICNIPKYWFPLVFLRTSHSYLNFQSQISCFKIQYNRPHCVFLSKYCLKISYQQLILSYSSNDMIYDIINKIFGEIDPGYFDLCPFVVRALYPGEMYGIMLTKTCTIIHIILNSNKARQSVII